MRLDAPTNGPAATPATRSVGAIGLKVLAGAGAGAGAAPLHGAALPFSVVDNQAA